MLRLTITGGTITCFLTLVGTRPYRSAVNSRRHLEKQKGQHFEKYQVGLSKLLVDNGKEIC